MTLLKVVFNRVASKLLKSVFNSLLKWVFNSGKEAVNKNLLFGWSARECLLIMKVNFNNGGRTALGQRRNSDTYDARTPRQRASPWTAAGGRGAEKFIFIWSRIYLTG